MFGLGQVLGIGDHSLQGQIRQQQLGGLSSILSGLSSGNNANINPQLNNIGLLRLLRQLQQQQNMPQQNTSAGLMSGFSPGKLY